MRAVLLVVAAALVSCGPPPAPSYITDAAGIESSPAAQDARVKAPALWKSATDALERARNAHAAGDEPRALALAMEASALFKTAIAVMREKKAGARIAAAERRIEEAGIELAKFKSLRIDSQARFLELHAYHETQKDAAKASLAAFKKDRDMMAGLEDGEKSKWLAVEAGRIATALQAAAGAVLAAEALGCEKLLPSETKETREALEKAQQAQGADWETTRPLSDDARLRADRLLNHTRTLNKPDPLENPATDAHLVERFVKALADTRVMVSATTRGILLSLRDPLDAKDGGLTDEALEAIGTSLGAMGDASKSVILVEAYLCEECSGEVCIEKSGKIALSAARELVNGGVPESAVFSRGWGESPPPDPGHCLAEACPGGRLDILIVNM
ncbi:MAG: DUF4398 domain-containing protein [Deltaproteobacteria bacterium]|nr:DUF4398 domain-containing protein [Deltaproteobacteria bacterium]